MIPRVPLLPVLLGVLVGVSLAAGPVRAEDAAAPRPAPTHPPTGKGDLDRAIALCDAHRAPAPATDTPATDPAGPDPDATGWTTGWEPCRDVDREWRTAWSRKEAADRAFVAQVARSGV